MRDEQLQAVTPELREHLKPMVEKCKAAEDRFTIPENLFFGVMFNHLNYRTPVPHTWIEVLYKLVARLDDKKFEYEAVAFDSLCSLKTFSVNGVEAHVEDFVEQHDYDPEHAYEGGCGNMQADVIPATERVLKEYGITLEEHTTIAEDIAEKLSFGRCDLCN